MMHPMKTICHSRGAIALLFMLTAFAAAAPLTPEEAKQLEAARTAQEAGNHAAAVQTLETLRQVHGDVADIHRLLGHSYAALNRADEARESLTQAIALGRLSSDVLARLAELERREEDLPALIADLRLLVALDPGNDAWRLTLADALVAGGATEEAALIYEHAMQMHPSAAVALRLGNVALQQQRHEQALDQLELAWRMGDRTPSLPRTLGDLAFKAEQPRRALEWYDLAQQLEPAQASTIAMRKAELRLNAGDLEGAERELAGIAEKTADAHVLLGRIRLEQERVDEAVKHFEQAERLGRVDTQLLTYLGAYHFNRGQYAQAVPYLQRRMNSGAADVALHRQLIISLIESGQKDKATQAASRMIEEFGLDAATPLLPRLTAAAGN